ncbi:MAG: hypothetical protein AAB669_00805 [Patescibacteria group bacterium]
MADREGAVQFELPNGDHVPVVSQNLELVEEGSVRPDDSPPRSSTARTPDGNRPSLRERFHLPARRKEAPADLQAKRVGLEQGLAVIDLQVSALQEELAQIEALPDNEPNKAGQKDSLQQHLDAINQQRDQFAIEYADNIIGRLSQGERIGEGERLFLAQDAVCRGEKSALGELVLNRHGFKTFQEAMGKMGVKSVRVEDVVVKLDQDKRYPWLKEHLTKTLVSGGISAGTLAYIGAFGGPIGWAGIVGGLVGGTIGRLAGEWWRYKSLGKERKDSNGTTYRLGETVMAQTLGLIQELRGEAKKALEASGDQNDRATALNNLLTIAAGKEIGRMNEYQKTDKKFRWVKAGLGAIGAIGGSALASFWQSGAEHSAKLAEAKAEGARIYHDASGQAHITKDLSLGHQAYQTNDGAWRFAIEQKDFTGYNELGHHTKGALEVAQDSGQDYQDIFHHYLGQGSHGETLQASVPYPLPTGQEFLHASEITDAGGAIESSIQQATQLKIWEVISVMAGATLAGEGAVNLHQKVSEDKLREDNRPLIDALEAEAFALKHGVDERNGQHSEVELPPANQRERLEKLARDRGLRLPQTPSNFEVGWYLQPQLLQDNFRLNKLPLWPRLGENRHNLLVDGQEVYDGIGEVDVDKNEVVIIYRKPDGRNAFRVVSLEDFLNTHGDPVFGDASPVVAPNDPAPRRGFNNHENNLDREDEVGDNRNLARLYNRLAEAIEADETPEALGRTVTKAEEAIVAHRIFERFNQTWNNLPTDIRWQTGVNFKYLQDAQGHEIERIILHTDDDNEYAALSFIRFGDNYRITTRDAGGNIDGAVMNRPIKLGYIIDFFREAYQRILTVEPNNQPDIQPVVEATPEPETTPELAPEPEVAPEAEPPVAEIEPEPEPGFSQDDFDRHNAIVAVNDIPVALWTFINRSLPNFLSPDGLISYRDADLNNDNITLINTNGQEHQFRFSFVRQIIDHLNEEETEEE